MRYSLILVCLLSAAADAKYIVPELESVPIDRLLANLERAAKAQPKNAQLRFQIARLYAMRYAVKREAVEVVKGRGEPWVPPSPEPKEIFFSVQKPSDAKQAAASRADLNRAIASYREALALDSQSLKIKLGLAWCLDQSGQKEEALRHYREIFDGAYRVWKTKKPVFSSERSIACETTEYLLPLLDTKRDASEISLVRTRIEDLGGKCEREITPILIGLESALSYTEAIDERGRVAFDLDGSGIRKHWAWPTSRAGWLVWDPRRTGRITSGLQLFGSVSFWVFWHDGYEALAALDDDGDGYLSGHELDGLFVWQDADHDGKSDPGELIPLERLGIVAIACRPEQHSPLGHSRGAIRSDGSALPTWDVVTRPSH